MTTTITLETDDAGVIKALADRLRQQQDRMEEEIRFQGNEIAAQYNWPPGAGDALVEHMRNQPVSIYLREIAHQLAAAAGTASSA